MKPIPRPIKETKKKLYEDFEPPKLDPVDVRIERLRKDLPKSEEALENYRPSFAPEIMKAFFERVIRQDKKELEDLQYEQFMATS